MDADYEGRMHAVKTRLIHVGMALAIITAAVPVLLLTTPQAQAQSVSSQLLAQYLGQTGVTWRVDEKNANVFYVTKTSGLKTAERIEIIITNIPDKDLVTLRAFPKVAGKYLSLAAARNQDGLMRTMLRNNATAFGAYFVDEDGDIGFRYVFTTESGLGYEAFKIAVNELLRIADDVMVSVYNTHR
jgi:hypothetical protein